MRILTALAALLLLVCPLAARAASCPDVLVGDSLAVGMGPYARAAGFQVVARNGIGLSWLRAQDPRCARRVVVVIGTNDLRGIDPYSAEAYPARLAAIMARWQTQQITWATPGCFPRDDSLERGSEALDRALAREPLVRVGGRRDYMRVHSGRTARCGHLSGDGIHPTGTGYRAWWASISQAIGPSPEDDRYQVASPVPQPYAREAARSVRHVRAGRPARSVREARAPRSAPSARTNRAGRPMLAGRQAPAQYARQAPPARSARSTASARADRQVRSPQAGRMQASAGRQGLSRQSSRSGQAARSAQPTRPSQVARSAQRTRPIRQAPGYGMPIPSRPMAVNPIRRT